MGNSQSNNNLNNMKFSSIFLLGLVLVNMCKAADIVVDVDLEELAHADMHGAPSDRTILCNLFGQGRCVTACAGQLCTSTCQARCGLFRTATYTCSAIAASTCATT